MHVSISKLGGSFKDIANQARPICWLDIILPLIAGAPESEQVSADDMIAGYKQLILRAHSRGIKIIGGTLLPWENETFAPDAYTPEAGARREAINTWIRSSGAFDGVVDFNKLLKDPAHPNGMLPKWDSGDRLHPGDVGYQHMGQAFDLSLLKWTKTFGRAPDVMFIAFPDE
jgi:lysophospholipase L1-like esterase